MILRLLVRASVIVTHANPRIRYLQSEILRICAQTARERGKMRAAASGEGSTQGSAPETQRHSRRARLNSHIREGHGNDDDRREADIPALRKRPDAHRARAPAPTSWRAPLAYAMIREQLTCATAPVLGRTARFRKPSWGQADRPGEREIQAVVIAMPMAHAGCMPADQG